MTLYSYHFSTRATPQQEQALPTQVKNSEGGYVFKLDCWKRLDRKSHVHKLHEIIHDRGIAYRFLEFFT